MLRFRDDVDFVRTVARAAFRAPDPIKAAAGLHRRLRRDCGGPDVYRSRAEHRAIAGRNRQPERRAHSDGPQAPPELRGRPCIGEGDASTSGAEHRPERLPCDRAPADSTALHEQLRHYYSGHQPDGPSTGTCRRVSEPFDRTTRCGGRSVIWRSSNKPGNRSGLHSERPARRAIFGLAIQPVDRERHASARLHSLLS